MMNQATTVDEAIAVLDSMIGQTKIQGRCNVCRKSLRFSCECDGEPTDRYVSGREADRIAGFHYPTM